ncbi:MULTISPECIES: relaxase/mobilization nuclease domain-containing protein [Clostridia]|uniref:relaxase/mobilization nuclease domain-containing protein n=1 Tax=Blautia schinkii TaxID=180164 RepID=UPI00156EA837|nr:relaxase/mobilization nuclease domain-containing protein [Blautia schinkii]NSK67011.1 relaxase/mobilization nuclease domain-containing protein [Blautia schinkii]
MLFILNIRIIFIYKFIGHAQYQVIFSIHENNSHLHVHIFVNTIDLTNDMLYNCDMHNFYAIRGHVKFVLQSYRLWYGEHPVRLLE